MRAQRLLSAAAGAAFVVAVIAPSAAAAEDPTSTDEFIEAVSATTWGALAVVVAAGVIWFAFGREASNDPGGARQYSKGLVLTGGIGATVVFGSLALTAASSESAAASIAAAIDTVATPVHDENLMSAAQEQSFSESDLALVDALAEDFRTDPDSLDTDPDCLARATVMALGGAASMESRHGITIATVGDFSSDLSLLPSQAQTLVDGYFECGLGEDFVTSILEDEDPQFQECMSNILDGGPLRDFLAAEWVVDNVEFVAAADEAFNAEVDASVELCEYLFPAPATDTSDIGGLILAFETVVVAQGFEFVGNYITGFAEVCLHPDPTLRFFEYQRGTTRVSLIAGAPNGLEASYFYDYLTQGPYDCELDSTLLDFLHVGVDGEFDVEDPYMRTIYQHPSEQLPRFEHYVRRGAFVYVASGFDRDEVAELRVLLRGTGPVG